MAGVRHAIRLMPIKFPEIKTIVEASQPGADGVLPWWWWVVAGVFLVLLLIAAGFLVQALMRHWSVRGLPAEPSRAAQASLARLQKQAGNMEPLAFAGQLHDIIRQYLQRRMGLMAASHTTEELLGRVRRADAPPPPPAVAAFAPVLDACDSVKFASPADLDRESLISAAARAIEQSLTPPSAA